MNKLLETIIQYFAFLYDDHGARFVDSLNGRGYAQVFLEAGDLRLRFVQDRLQGFVDLQSKHAVNRDDWFSLDIVRQLITGVVDDEAILWGTIGGTPEIDRKNAAKCAEFLKTRFAEIANAFSESRHIATEKTLHEYEQARGDRLFGKIVPLPLNDPRRADLDRQKNG